MNRKIVYILGVLFVLFFLVSVSFADNGGQFISGDTQSPTADENDDFTSLIVKYKENRKIAESAISERLSRFGSVYHRRMSNSRRFSLLRFDRKLHAVRDLIARIKADKDVEYVEPNYIMRVFSLPNDPHYQFQWNMQQLRIPEAWDITMGRAEVKVAVVDSGVAYNLDDLAGTRFDLQNDWDFVDNDDDAYDANGHGTHCTGTIAQSTNNNIGTVGIAPGVTILPVRVMGPAGVGDLMNVANGIVYAADHGADIVTLSLGGGQATNTMRNALRYAYERGVTIFAATGNDGRGNVSFPAAFDEYVIAVGATRYDKQKAGYSTYGNSLDIVAPGGDTAVDQNGDGRPDGILQQTITGYRFFRTDYTPVYAFFQGTSMACPHAAGVAALLKSYKPDATPAEIRAAIQNTAEDLGAPGWDNRYGHGLINPVAALAYIGGGDDNGNGDDDGDDGGDDGDDTDTCEQWSATNDQHVAAGRAYVQSETLGCGTVTTTYYAVGSNINLGASGFATTMLHSTDGGQTYMVGNCPVAPPDVDDDDIVTNGSFNGTYFMVADHSGKALDTWEWGTANGTNIAQYDFWEGEAQQFNITPVNNPWHRISPVIATGQAMQVANCATNAGANIQTWAYSGQECQQFRFEMAGQGMYRIIARHSGMCVEVLNASTADGANVVQNTCVDGARSQLFQVLRR